VGSGRYRFAECMTGQRIEVVQKGTGVNSQCKDVGRIGLASKGSAYRPARRLHCASLGQRWFRLRPGNRGMAASQLTAASPPPQPAAVPVRGLSKPAHGGGHHCAARGAHPAVPPRHRAAARPLDRAGRWGLAGDSCDFKGRKKSGDALAMLGRCGDWTRQSCCLPCQPCWPVAWEL